MSETSDTKFVRANRLYDYTKFHAGLYGSLVFGVVALIQVGGKDAVLSELVLRLAGYAVVCWSLAGFAAGVILGNLVESNCSLKDFRSNLLVLLGGDGCLVNIGRHSNI